MPLYEFKCTTCGHGFEELMGSGKVVAPRCPECGAATERQLSTFSAAIHTGGNDCPAAGGCSTGSCSAGGCPFA